MTETINIKELRASLPKIVERVKRGERFTVLYRSRPAFRIVPVQEEDMVSSPLQKDPLYGSGAVGESSDGLAAANHDELLYGTDTR
jgi:prevent-host-death family protein